MADPDTTGHDGVPLDWEDCPKCKAVRFYPSGRCMQGCDGFLVQKPKPSSDTTAVTGYWDCDCGRECRHKEGPERPPMCRAEWVQITPALVQTTAPVLGKYAGFSNEELLRRARVLRDIASGELPVDRRKLEKLALEHEDAAREVRRRWGNQA